jgi:hypothetical protein
MREAVQKLINAKVEEKVQTVRTEYEEKITKIQAVKKPVVTSKVNLSSGVGAGKPNG